METKTTKKTPEAKSIKSMLTNLKASLNSSAPSSEAARRNAGLAAARLKILKQESGMTEQSLLVRMINYAYENDPFLAAFKD